MSCSGTHSLTLPAGTLSPPVYVYVSTGVEWSWSVLQAASRPPPSSCPDLTRLTTPTRQQATNHNCPVRRTRGVIDDRAPLVKRNVFLMQAGGYVQQRHYRTMNGITDLAINQFNLIIFYTVVVVVVVIS